MLKPPLIILNVKAYEQSVGEKGLALAKACREVSEETGVTIAISPQQVDLAWIARQVDIPCFAQHVDAISPGSHTGWVSLKAIKEANAVGTLLNHSEHPMKIIDVDKVIQQAKELDILVVACTNNLSVTKAIAELSPYSIAVEPPQLIGTGIPVSKADPEIVSSSVKAVKKIDSSIVVLCGAGISTGEDVKAAIELGAEGVLLASGVVKAKDPKKALLDLASF